MQRSPTERLTAAALAAARWHNTQRRKGSADEPYVNHLLEVASLVSKATGDNDINLVIAALLHDAIEDQGISRSLIAEQFDDDVASLVAEVTDDKSLPQAVRKRLQVEHAPEKSNRAKILKLADKIATSPPSARIHRPIGPLRGSENTSSGAATWSQACAEPPQNSRRSSTAPRMRPIVSSTRGAR
jgi:(p)ppGpp synthase/HD superfamily hydrolase